MTTLSIYRCINRERTRAMCPHHKHLCYGEKQEFYDTIRIFFDCGTMVDFGYGYFDPPKLYKHIKIFKDEVGYTAWIPKAGWIIIARQVSLNKARKIAKSRLKQDGKITEY